MMILNMIMVLMMMMNVIPDDTRNNLYSFLSPVIFT